MPAGRPRTPSKLKALAGNPGKRAIPKDEPLPTGAPVAPKVMTKRAAAIWKRLVGSMPIGVYAVADERLIAAYCEAAARHEEATTALMEVELVTTGSTGQLVASPWLKIQNDQARLLTTIGARLGLDPAARQSLSTPKENQANEFDGLIN